MLVTILLIFALVLFILGASNRVATSYNLVAAGLAFVVASMLAPLIHL